VDERTVECYYEYVDAEGAPLFRVIRYDPKGFSQERWDGAAYVPRLGLTKRVPYRLPELLNVGERDPIYLVEGEKDADSVVRAGACGTTLVGGAGKWRPDYGQYFAGSSVRVVADNDEPGIAGANRIAEGIREAGGVADIYLPADGYHDISEQLESGIRLEDIRLLSAEPTAEQEFGALDWATYKKQDTDWLLRPWVPAGARVLAFGPAGSLKSLWALWLACKLAASGKHVAYFSLEMTATDTVSRIAHADPPEEFFHLFTKLDIGSEYHLHMMQKAFKGYSLIVVDSWNSSIQKGSNDPDFISQMDKEVWQPLIDTTGATLLILDNTGHPVFTDKGTFKPEHARGSTAKGDKVDVSLYFDRPYESNNYLTTIKMKKIRLDEEIPVPITVVAPKDTLEFYYADGDGNPTTSLWTDDADAQSIIESDALGSEDRLALARVIDQLKAVEIT